MAASGGVERFIFDIARRLEERDVAVTLISEPFAPAEPFAGRVLELPRSHGGRAARFRRFQAAVGEALAGESFSLVQSHERVLTADLYRAGDGVHAAWFARLQRSRPKWRAAGMRLDPMHRLYMATERRMAQETPMLFVANSTLVARELGEYLDLAPSRIRLIENGVDLDRFAPADDAVRAQARRGLGLGEAGPVAVFVGSGFERKGAFHLVRALADPGLSDLRVIIAGRDKAEGALGDLVARLGLAGRVHLAGSVADVCPILHAADMFVLPTLYDPMPNAALEAVACGLPVVTTPDAGIAEVIEETGAGAVAAREAEPLAAALIDVLGRIEDARAAAFALRPRFALADTVDRWLDLYRELS
jgi:UDP-glucose:(heptosyl)LPS alpha-1,3-glucosyltransferase